VAFAKKSSLNGKEIYFLVASRMEGGEVYQEVHCCLGPCASLPEALRYWGDLARRSRARAEQCEREAALLAARAAPFGPFLHRGPRLGAGFYRSLEAASLYSLDAVRAETHLRHLRRYLREGHEPCCASAPVSAAHAPASSSALPSVWTALARRAPNCRWL